MKNYKLLGHKVGIKILDENTLENIFPMYQSMMNKISECRSVASEHTGWFGKRRYQYNFMYDNVFSILGKRGTGKTSVAFSLKEIIENSKENPKDVVLPIIIPEVIPENCTVLGWLLAVIKEEVEYLEDQIKNQKTTGYEKREDYWDNCRHSDEIGNLSEKLKQLSRMVFAGKYNPANENSYYKAVGNSAVQADDYYQFANEIAEFWNMWIKAIKDLNIQANQEYNNNCPLIFFIFDDVDLSPERIGELLSVIIKYLSHPNLIVITTADEKLFLDVLENRLDKSIGRLPREWRAYLSKKTQDGIIYYPDRDISKPDGTDFLGETARMYLGKVMPPSMRYYLRTFNTASQKAHFLMDDKQILGESVRKQIEEIMSHSLKDKKRQACFMGKENQINNFYLNYFGNTSRQIANIYIGIINLVNNLVEEVSKVKNGKRKKEAYLSKVYEICRYFISLVIHTNHNLGNIIDPVDKFIDGVFMTEYRRKRLYINYTYMAGFLENYYEDNDIQEDFNIRIQLYSLLAFVENILLVLESCTKYGITGRQNIHLVKPLAEYLNQYVFDGRYVFRDDFDEIQFFKHYGLLLDHLDGIIDNRDSDKMLNFEYFYNFCNEFYCKNNLRFNDMVQMYQENQSWFREITEMIAMVYGGAYLVEWKFIENIIPFWSDKSIMSYQIYADQALNENIKTYMEVFNLYEYARKNIEKINIVDLQFNEHNYEKFKLKIRDELLEKLEEQNKDGYGPFIPLATLLKHIEDMHDKPEYVLGHCPKGILDGLFDILLLTDKKDVQEFLQKEIVQIEEIAEMTNQVAFYFPHKWVLVLDELRSNENPVIRRKVRILHQLIGWVFDEEGIIKENTEHILVEYGAADLLRLRSLFDELLDDIYMDEELKHRVQELFNDLDFVIDLNNLAEFERAVNIGIHMLVAEYLQKLYLSLNIKERYERAGYFSPKNLQWVSEKEDGRKTYYYQLFEIMEKTLDEAGQENTRQSRNKEEIRHLISRITRNQRRKYIDRILREKR